ncbi:hypothetical protein ACQPYH_35750 [Kribbella sp. CA-245084]|uniref:hypothetical protein n=1 Tax=Kribbella sp. CA-245084 TaxID=3239940 RepID=UPI003D90F942
MGVEYASVHPLARNSSAATYGSDVAKIGVSTHDILPEIVPDDIDIARTPLDLQLLRRAIADKQSEIPDVPVPDQLRRLLT